MIANCEYCTMRGTSECLQDKCYHKMRRKLSIYRTCLANSKIRARDAEKRAVDEMNLELRFQHERNQFAAQLAQAQAELSRLQTRNRQLEALSAGRNPCDGCQGVCNPPEGDCAYRWAKELKAEVERLKAELDFQLDGPLMTCPVCGKRLADDSTRAQLAHILDCLAIETERAEKAASALTDYRSAHEKVMSEKCGDEQHCACVPALRMELKDLRELKARVDGAPVIEAVFSNGNTYCDCADGGYFLLGGNAFGLIPNARRKARIVLVKEGE